MTLLIGSEKQANTLVDAGLKSEDPSLPSLTKERPQTFQTYRAKICFLLVSHFFEVSEDFDPHLGSAPELPTVLQNLNQWIEEEGSFASALFRLSIEERKLLEQTVGKGELRILTNLEHESRPREFWKAVAKFAKALSSKYDKDRASLGALALIQKAYEESQDSANKGSSFAPNTYVAKQAQAHFKMLTGEEGGWARLEHLFGKGAGELSDIRVMGPILLTGFLGKAVEVRTLKFIADGRKARLLLGEIPHIFHQGWLARITAGTSALAVEGPVFGLGTRWAMQGSGEKSHTSLGQDLAAAYTDLAIFKTFGGVSKLGMKHGLRIPVYGTEALGVWQRTALTAVPLAAQYAGFRMTHPVKYALGITDHKASQLSWLDDLLTVGKLHIGLGLAHRAMPWLHEPFAKMERDLQLYDPLLFHQELWKSSLSDFWKILTAPRVPGLLMVIPIGNGRNITWLPTFTKLVGDADFKTRVGELARKVGLDKIEMDDITTLAYEFNEGIEGVIAAANQVRFPDFNFSQYTASDGHPILIAHEREAANLRHLHKVDPDRRSVAWYVLENRTHPDHYFSRDQLARSSGVGDNTLRLLESAEVLERGETNYPVRETFWRLQSVLPVSWMDLAGAFNRTIYPDLALDRLTPGFRPFIDHNTTDKSKIDGYLYLLDQQVRGMSVGTCQIAFFVYRHQQDGYPSHDTLSIMLGRGANFWNKLETDELKSGDVPWGEVSAELTRAGLPTGPLLDLLRSRGFKMDMSNPLHVPAELRRLAVLKKEAGGMDQTSPRVILLRSLGADGVAQAAAKIGINRGTLAVWINREDSPLASASVLAKIRAAYPQFEADRFYLAQRQRVAKPGDKTIVDFFPTLAEEIPYLGVTREMMDQATSLHLPPLVAEARGSRNMTAIQFGDLIGASRAVVSRLEAEKKQIQDLNVLWRLSGVLGLDSRVLFIHNEPDVLEIFNISNP